MAQIIDLFTDHEIVTASAVPSVIPLRTDSFTFPPFAIVNTYLVVCFTIDSSNLE